jgi:hypothetical protein
MAMGFDEMPDDARRNPCTSAQSTLTPKHQPPATIPSRRTEPPDARLAHRCQKVGTPRTA